MFLPQMKASVAKAFVICGKFRRNDLFHYKQTVLKGRYNVFPKTSYKLIYLIHGIIKKKKKHLQGRRAIWNVALIGAL